MYEKSIEAGYSHFFEHMVFRNVNRLMSGELYRELDKFGLTLSGTTYNEFIQLSICGSPKFFNKASEILTLALEEIVVTKEELSGERERVKREIREDTYSSTIDALSQKAVWCGTSLSETITGSVGNLSKITVNKLKKFSQTLMSRNNIFFYLTGAFCEDNVDFLTSLVDKKELPLSPKRQNLAPVPPLFFKRACEVKAKRDDVCKVKLAFDVDTEKVKKPVRDLIYDILFQGDTSQVFLELSEKNGYVYSYDANFEEYLNVGVLTLSFETSKADFSKALEVVKDIFISLRENEEEDRLALAKVPYTENYLFILDDAEALNFNKAVESHFLGFDYKTLEERRAFYEKVTGNDVKEGAKEIFKKENLTVSIKHKNPEFAIKEVKRIFFDGNF